jgi:ABC-type nitrate/sulfonate/bicarbonate transport system ATPase subunit
VQIKNLSHSFGDKKVLSDINLTVEPQAFHTLIGLSGSGKTLILRIVSGLEKVQEGDLLEIPEKLSFVFQKAPFFSWLTILKNLEICTHIHCDEIKATLKKLRLEQFSEMYPHQLSGGTLQKFNIIRSFLNGAKLVLMDEPFVHLDLIQKEELYTFTLELWREYKITIILVTHDLDEAIYLSTEVSYLSTKKKTIEDTFLIDIDNSVPFNTNKTTKSHRDFFNNIYQRLKSDLTA